MTSKIVHVIGGGTVRHIDLDSHLYVEFGSKAKGTVARRLAELCREQETMEVQLHLTHMADETSAIVTNEDLKAHLRGLVDDKRTKMVFWTPAVADFDPSVLNHKTGKRVGRLRTYDEEGKPLSYDYHFRLTPSEKLVRMIRKGSHDRSARKDIFLVAFKQTWGATEAEQYRQGLNLLKSASANLVLANDSKTRLNMVIVPEEASYHVTHDREEALRGLVEMAYLRSQLTFTRSTVVAGDPVPWDSPLVPQALRAVVNHCIERGAYKPFRGVTAGHFAIKLGDTTFLTSRRKTNFNDLGSVGMVRVETDGPDSVIAYGFKPSVGGQSQRIVFKDHPGTDCIVHFHCPLKEGSKVPVVSQREYECGSHECGRNTSRGLRKFGNLWAVYLSDHGPNVVFGKDTDPKEVIDFIDANFELADKTGGMVKDLMPAYIAALQKQDRDEERPYLAATADPS